MPWTVRQADLDDIQQLFDISQNLEPSAVLAQVIVMTVLSLFTILAFDLLRPTNKYVYEPKMIYHTPNKDPPRISQSLLGWLPPLFNNNEQDLFNNIGLDALTFLRFLRLMRWLFTFTAIVTGCTLIPLNRLYTVSTNPPPYNSLTSLTIRDVHGSRLYAHISCVYIITLTLMALLYHHWLEMSQLRKQWFKSREYQNAFYARTLLITNIPPKYRSEEGLWKIFQGMELKSQVTSVHIGKTVGMLPDLIEKHNHNVREFEIVLTRHIKKTPRSRKQPTIRVGGFCGCGGTRKDAIKHYTTKMQQLAAAVEQYRAQLHEHQPETFGFASMSSIPAAHGAAYDLRKEQPKGMTIKLAPNPNDILWTNIALTKPDRRFRISSGFTFLIFFCIFSLIPLFPVASLANLNALARSGAILSLKTWITSSPKTYAIVSGVGPPVVAALFGFILPRLMRKLSKYMGAHTHTRLDRVVVARYFTFMIISHLIIFTIIGVIYNAVVELIAIIRTQKVTFGIIWGNINKLPAKLTRTYVDQTTFWLTWLALRGFLIFTDLAQFEKLIWISFKTWMFGLTPREIRERSGPPLFEYDIKYSDFLFMGAVGMVFAPLAPLVPLGVAIVFWMASFVYKYQLIYVFVTRVESGGRSWNTVVNRVIFSVLFMQVLMIFTIGLQNEFQSLQLLAAVPPPILTLLYKHYLNSRFANDFQYFLPQHDELSRAVVHSEEVDMVNRKLEGRYTHPAIQDELFTPMIHVKATAYLKSTLKGKFKKADLARDVEKKSVSTADKVEDLLGVPITPVHDDELRPDPVQYGRDREEACDVDVAPSIFSSQGSAPWRQPHVHEVHRSHPSSSPSNTLPGISGRWQSDQYPSITSSTSSYQTAADNYDVDGNSGPSSSAKQHHSLQGVRVIPEGPGHRPPQHESRRHSDSHGPISPKVHPLSRNP